MATTTTKRARDYLKFRAVATERERVAVWILIPAVLVIVLMFWGIPPLNIIPVWGPSMQPTLAVWNIPEPWARFSFSGWVHYDPAMKPQVGNIVYFRIPNTRVHEVKRVTKINNGKLWVEPDNPGVSGEGSDNSDLYKWLCPESVIGVVDAIGTPTRAIRWFTAEGRFRNWVELKTSPKDILWMEEEGLVAVGNQVHRLSGDLVARFPIGYRVLYLSPVGVVGVKSEGEIESVEVTLLIFNPTPGVVVEGRESHNYTGGILGYQDQIDEKVEAGGSWTYFRYEIVPASPLG